MGNVLVIAIPGQSLGQPPQQGLLTTGMKRQIFILTVFIFVLFLYLSHTYAKEHNTFPCLKPPDHLSTSSVIRLEDGELIRSVSSREDMQTLVGSIFGADTYFRELNKEAPQGGLQTGLTGDRPDECPGTGQEMAFPSDCYQQNRIALLKPPGP